MIDTWKGYVYGTKDVTGIDFRQCVVLTVLHC